PTIVGEQLFAMGIEGDVVCLNVADGERVWHVNVQKEFGGHMPGWGYSESPLVDGDKVIVAPGGRGAAIVALDRRTGKTIWRANVPQGDGAQYASAIVAEIDGVRQYVHFLTGGVVAVAAEDGKFLWRYDHPHNGTANCSTPLFGDGCVFAG